ncbi:hypothetical protein AAMO2058_000510800 [Amorphochlora amoebiformis]
MLLLLSMVAAPAAARIRTSRGPYDGSMSMHALGARSEGYRMQPPPPLDLPHTLPKTGNNDHAFQPKALKDLPVSPGFHPLGEGGRFRDISPGNEGFGDPKGLGDEGGGTANGIIDPKSLLADPPKTTPLYSVPMTGKSQESEPPVNSPSNKKLEDKDLNSGGNMEIKDRGAFQAILPIPRHHRAKLNTGEAMRVCFRENLYDSSEQLADSGNCAFSLNNGKTAILQASKLRGIDFNAEIAIGDILRFGVTNLDEFCRVAMNLQQSLISLKSLQEATSTEEWGTFGGCPPQGTDPSLHRAMTSVAREADELILRQPGDVYELYEDLEANNTAQSSSLPRFTSRQHKNLQALLSEARKAAVENKSSYVKEKNILLGLEGNSEEMKRNSSLRPKGGEKDDDDSLLKPIPLLGNENSARLAHKQWGLSHGYAPTTITQSKPRFMSRGGPAGVFLEISDTIEEGGGAGVEIGVAEGLVRGAVGFLTAISQPEVTDTCLSKPNFPLSSAFHSPGSLGTIKINDFRSACLVYSALPYLYPEGLNQSETSRAFVRSPYAFLSRFSSALKNSDKKIENCADLHESLTSVDFETKVHPSAQSKEHGSMSVDTGTPAELCIALSALKDTFDKESAVSGVAKRDIEEGLKFLKSLPDAVSRCGGNKNANSVVKRVVVLNGGLIFTPKDVHGLCVVTEALADAGIE